MKSAKRTLSLVLVALIISLTGCEDPIDIDLDEGKSELVVDAFITDLLDEQIVTVSKTTSYFDNTTELSISDATVTIKDDQDNTYNFVHTTGGEYVYDAAVGGPVIVADRNYTLRVEAEGEVYEAQTFANPVPEIDRIEYEFREADFGDEEGYYASFFAKDFAGRDDYYWIRTFTNDTLDSDPGRINISINAAFGGDGADGLTFILPIREGITDSEFPFSLNDNVRVELWAITEESWNFLNEVRTQLTNQGLFATPTANVRTNIVNTDPASDKTAVGWFSTASVSVAEVTIQ